jgi:hypothetical protein
LAGHDLAVFFSCAICPAPYYLRSGQKRPVHPNPVKMAAAKKAVTAAAFRPQDFEIRKEQSGQAAHQSD